MVLSHCAEAGGYSAAKWASSSPSSQQYISRLFWARFIPSTPSHPIIFEIHLSLCLPNGLSLVFSTNPVTISVLMPTCNMSSPSHSSGFHRPTGILLSRSFTLCNYLPSAPTWPKYLPQYLVLSLRRFWFFPLKWETKFHCWGRFNCPGHLDTKSYCKEILKYDVAFVTNKCYVSSPSEPCL
jgi:hypothetical protein